MVFTSGWRLFEPDQKLAKEAYDDHVCPGEASAPPPPIPGVGRMGGQLALSDRSTRDPATWSSELLRLANLQDGQRFRELLASAQRHNVTFYPVNPEGLEVFDTQLGERSQFEGVGSGAFSAKRGETACPLISTMTLKISGCPQVLGEPAQVGTDCSPTTYTHPSGGRICVRVTA